MVYCCYVRAEATIKLISAIQEVLLNRELKAEMKLIEEEKI